MKPQDVLEYFGSGYQFGKKSGMTRNSLRNWRKWGFVPIASQIKLQKLTKGVLKADIDYLED